MKTTINFRSKVFKRAYEIMRATGKTFAVCLSKARACYRLIQKMRNDVTEFAFEKADGTLRRAKGILKDVATSTKQRKPNYKTVAYFDVEKQGFRCFKVENLVTIF